jgi:hypothetical protein
MQEWSQWTAVIILRKFTRKHELSDATKRAVVLTGLKLTKEEQEEQEGRDMSGGIGGVVYQVQARSHNSGGWGNWSSSMLARTKPAVPLPRVLVRMNGMQEGVLDDVADLLTKAQNEDSGRDRVLPGLRARLAKSAAVAARVVSKVDFVMGTKGGARRGSGGGNVGGGGQDQAVVKVWEGQSRVYPRCAKGWGQTSQQRWSKKARERAQEEQEEAKAEAGHDERVKGDGWVANSETTRQYHSLYGGRKTRRLLRAHSAGRGSNTYAGWVRRLAGWMSPFQAGLADHTNIAAKAAAANAAWKREGSGLERALERADAAYTSGPTADEGGSIFRSCVLFYTISNTTLDPRTGKLTKKTISSPTARYDLNEDKGWVIACGISIGSMHLGQKSG